MCQGSPQLIKQPTLELTINLYKTVEHGDLLIFNASCGEHYIFVKFEIKGKKGVSQNW